MITEHRGTVLLCLHRGLLIVLFFEVSAKMPRHMRIKSKTGIYHVI